MGTGIITTSPVLSDTDLTKLRDDIKFYEAIPLPTLPDKVPDEKDKEAREIYDMRLRFIMSVKMPLEQAKATFSKENTARTIYNITPIKMVDDVVKG